MKKKIFGRLTVFSVTTLLLPLTFSFVSREEFTTFSISYPEFSVSDLYNRLSRKEKAIFDRFSAALNLNNGQKRAVLLYKFGYKLLIIDKSVFGKSNAFAKFLFETIGIDYNDLISKISDWFLNPNNKKKGLTTINVIGWLNQLPRLQVFNLLQFAYNGPYILLRR